MIKLRWKRWLYLWHRWLGIGLCLLFAAWFVSGMVMMYVDFPQLDRAERLPGLAPLDFSTAQLSPAAAVAQLSVADFRVVGAPDANRFMPVQPDGRAAISPLAVRLGMFKDRPVYIVDAGRGAQPRLVFADRGAVLREVSAGDAEESVARFLAQQASAPFAPAGRAGPAAGAVRHIELRQTDQWTLSGSLNAHRPLHRLALDDAAGSEFYVSSTTGEVVRDTTRIERGLNYVGAVTHWIYPTVIRRHPALWVWLVDILAAAGTVLAITGLWIGILRWNRKRRPGRSAVPYRGLMRWHYFVGACFGLFTLTWVFSGLLSMNPGGFNPPRAPTPAQLAVTRGVEESLRMADFNELPRFGATRDDGVVVEAELLHYAGQPVYLATLRDGSRRLVDLAGRPLQTDLQWLRAQVPALLPGAPLHAVERLDRYDSHYYSRHPERGDKPLPVLRVRFADAAETWFHIDIATARVLERSSATNRLYRWLYQGLHSWDLPWLRQRRPLWDIAVIGGLLGGLALSLTGAVTGWRRLVGTRPRYKRRSADSAR